MYTTKNKLWRIKNTKYVCKFVSPLNIIIGSSARYITALVNLGSKNHLSLSIESVKSKPSSSTYSKELYYYAQLG